MDTTTKYKVDQHIRAYDFPGLDRKAYFVEGIVLRVDLLPAINNVHFSAIWDVQKTENRDVQISRFKFS